MSPDRIIARGAGGLPTYVRPLRAVAIALFQADGRLLDANAGFSALMDRYRLSGGAGLLLHPGLEELLTRSPDTPKTPIHDGLIQLGRSDDAVHSLRGQVYRDGDGLLLVAEHDIEELATITEQLTQLNHDYAEMQRQVVRANRILTAERDRAEHRSLHDPLTGLFNRRAFDERFASERARSRREDRPLAVAVADLDHFKRINDDHGHLVGDLVLQAFSQCLQQTLRPYDICARLGGEEFGLLLPGTTLATAVTALERLRSRFASRDTGTSGVRATVSIGVVQLQPGDDRDAVLRRADRVLYAAKHAGRNRVCAETGEQPPCQTAADI